MRFHQSTARRISVPTSIAAQRRADRRMSAALWVVQGLVALVFLMAGSMKLVMPLEAMAMPVALPGWFLRFIGIAEVLGAIGLIVPSVTRIRPGLTPLAACGLLIIMTGATVVTLVGGGGAQALGPVVIGGLLAGIVHGRAQRLPIATRGVARTDAVIESAVRRRDSVAASA